MDCTNSCYVRHLEQSNTDNTLKFFEINLVWNCQIASMIFLPSQVVFGLLLLSIAVVLIWDIKYNPFGEDEDRF